MAQQMENLALGDLMSDKFRAKLRQLPAAKNPRHEQSAARKRIVENFAEITNAKRRGVTWQSIANLMNEDGIRSTNGSLLTASQVSSAYSVEKAARGERKRRKPAGASQAKQERLNAPEPTPKPTAEPTPTLTYSDSKALARAKLKAQMIPIRKKE